MNARDELQRLVLSLPEEALPHARDVLQHMQTWPPVPPPELAREMERSQKRIEERIQELRDRNRSRGLMEGGGGVGFASWDDHDRKQNSRHSSGYRDGAVSVEESLIVHDGHELTAVERITIDETINALVFALEVTGPDGTTRSEQFAFDLPPTNR